MPPADYARLDDLALVGLIFTEGDRLPSAWAQEAVSRGERLVPLLAKTATDLKAWERDDVAGWGPLHACYILGAIGGAEAGEALLIAFDLSARVDNDWIHEDWQSIFGRLGPGVLDGLRERAEDGMGDQFWTAASLSGMAAVASRRPELQEKVFAEVAAFASDPDRTDTSRALAGNILLDFRQTKYRDLLLSLAELEDNDVFLPDEVDAELAKAEPDLTWYQHDWLTFYSPEEVAGRQARWQKERYGLDEAWYAAVGAAAEELDDLPPIAKRKAEQRLGGHAALLDKARQVLKPYIEDLDDGQLTECHALAMELYGLILQDAALWRFFDAALEDFDLAEWLISLPLELEKRGRVDEAERLGLAWANIRLPDIFLSDRALILARAGRAQEAREQARLVRKLFGSDFWIEVKAGKTYALLGDWGAAEEIFRSARRRAPFETEREHVTQLLAEVLQKAGKTADAHALEEEEAALAYEQLAERPASRGYVGTIIRDAPKVGRNDPCPCGSGLKHKKCCLGK